MRRGTSWASGGTELSEEEVFGTVLFPKFLKQRLDDIFSNAMDLTVQQQQEMRGGFFPEVTRPVLRRVHQEISAFVDADWCELSLLPLRSKLKWIHTLMVNSEQEA